MTLAEPLFIERAVVGPIATNCYLLRAGENGRETVLVDPGDRPELLLGALRDRRAEVRAILLTHGHFDHVMAVNEIREAYPACRTFISEKEKPMVEDRELNAPFFSGNYRIRPDVYVKDGDELAFLGRTFRVIESPGHTAGSVCYYDAGDRVLFSGDTIFHESFGRTDLPTGSEEAMRASLEKLLTSLPEDTRIYPGHGPETSVGYEREAEGFTV